MSENYIDNVINKELENIGYNFVNDLPEKRQQAYNFLKTWHEDRTIYYKNISENNPNVIAFESLYNYHAGMKLHYELRIE